MPQNFDQTIFVTQTDLEQLIGSAHVTVAIIQKRYQAALEEIARLEAELVSHTAEVSK